MYATVTTEGLNKLRDYYKGLREECYARLQEMHRIGNQQGQGDYRAYAEEYELKLMEINAELIHRGE